MVEAEVGGGEGKEGAEREGREVVVERGGEEGRGLVLVMQ